MNISIYISYYVYERNDDSREKKVRVCHAIHLLGGNRYQGPVVSLENLGNGSTNPFAAIGGHRRRGSGGCCGGRCWRFAISIDVIVVIVSARRRNRRAAAFRFDVVHLHPLRRVRRANNRFPPRSSRVSKDTVRSYTISVLPIYRVRHTENTSHLVSASTRSSLNRSVRHRPWYRRRFCYRFIIAANVWASVSPWFSPLGLIINFNCWSRASFPLPYGISGVTSRSTTVTFIINITVD